MKKCHFIGIGGIGMSGLARLMLKQNVAVSGSDITSSSVTDSLSNAGAQIFIGHCANHINAEATVVFSSDIKKDNPEYQAAIDHHCPMLHRSQLLQYLMERYKGLAVAGTHGKTTTSSLLAYVLEQGGVSPSYAIGGIVPQLSSNAGQGDGEYFVAEADESDGSFLNYTPYGAIVTNIDLDHMDHYKTEIALNSAFKHFCEKVKSFDHLFWCCDDSSLRNLGMDRGISYGFSKDSTLRASNFNQKGWSISYDIDFKGKHYANVEVSLTGKHNALNSLAVFGLALSLGLKEADIRSALKSFKGVLRRCEVKGERQGILFLDDYAHHPTEIKATLAAVRSAIGERRLIVVYQPHRYSRAKDCMGQYNQVFNPADVLLVTEIYAARETPIPGVSHESIVLQVQKEIGGCCQHISRVGVTNHLCHILRPHDVVLTLGAGDVTKVSDEVLERLHTPVKYKVGLICGGASVEHDISLISAENILAAMNPTYYDVTLFRISRNGVWNGCSSVRQQLEEKADDERISAEVVANLNQCDILFPALHGTFGEDGTMQGFLDILGKPYTGPDHRSASISMDKVLTKRLAIEAGLPTAKFVSFTRYDWNVNRDTCLDKISEELTYPLFVKPAHLGSSIGIYKVVRQSELSQAIENALKLDDKLVIENGLENIREIEFSVIGNHEITVFPPGEVYAQGCVHDYDSKYGLNPQKPANAFDTKAKLTEEEIERGIALVKAVYKTVGCTGMARIDTFLDQEGNFWLNEINPIPGFTKYSLFPLMCEANKMAWSDLVDRLIVLGLHRKRYLRGVG